MKTQNNKISFKNISFVLNEWYNLSFRYRVDNIIEALTQRGIQSRVFGLNEIFSSLNSILQSDIVVLYRAPYNYQTRFLIKKLKEAGIPTVYDLDDLIFDLEYDTELNNIKNLPEYKASLKLDYEERNRQIIKSVDFVTTSVDFLTNKIKTLGVKAETVINTINTAQFLTSEQLLFKKDKKDSKTRIGYFCGSPTHNKDFLLVEEALYRILNKYPEIELHIVGFLKFDKKFDSFKSRIIKAPFMHYLEMLGYLSNMDINIAPLQINSVTNSKSELKIFEAGLVEVPTIASATEPYKSCIVNGKNGFLAHNSDEWYNCLELLVKNHDIASTTGKQARKDFLKKFYVQNNIDNFTGIYTGFIAKYHNIPSKKVILPEYKINIQEEIARKLDFNDLKSYPFTYNFNIEKLSLDKIINDRYTRKKIRIFVDRNKGKKILFYGAGALAQELLKQKEEFNLGKLDILGFIDGNPDKEGQILDEYPVFSISSIKTLNPDIIVISVVTVEEIEPVLWKIKTNYSLEYEIINNLLLRVST